MYNPITEEKIRAIPTIGNISNESLPDQLTRIYAQIVSLRRRLTDGTIDFQPDRFEADIQLLQTLANNLETLLITIDSIENRESIGFVAGTANYLLFKIGQLYASDDTLLRIDNISAGISAILLFLIGNSQADAKEVADQIKISNDEQTIQNTLVQNIQNLAKGSLRRIIDSSLNEIVLDDPDLQDLALNYLWKEIGLGINDLALQLLGESEVGPAINRFDRVISLSVSENPHSMGYRSSFGGPYQLAKLLKILYDDILGRAVVNIPPPTGIDSILWSSFLIELAKERPYLWENHQHVIENDFLIPGISAILTLPTGAGKSTLTELKIASCLISHRQVIYLVPTHALEDQIRRNLRALFKDIDLLKAEFDGEYTEIIQSDDLPILVMTPERCLALLNMDPESISSVGLVVFDEFHLIHGTDLRRDTRSIDAMYCLLSLLNIATKADYLLISAMVENGREIADWIEFVIGRKCRSFNSSWKPTRQLQGCLIYEQADINTLNNNIRETRKKVTTKYPPAPLQRSLGIQPHCFFSLKYAWESNNRRDYYATPITERQVMLKAVARPNGAWALTPNRNDVAAHISLHFANMGIKTLIFVDDPRIAFSVLKKIDQGLRGRQNNYNEFIDTHDQLMQGLATELGDIKYSYFYEQHHIGIHHGRLLPIERELIEQYFKEADGSICMVATATLAQGVNLPAEIVIIAGDDRFDDETSVRERIPPHELLNAAGRAGRAGHASQGAVILIPGEIVTIDGYNVSQRWWHLKNEVFSKSDQCLKIEDPLEYFLDAINESEILTQEQINVLYRFRSDDSSDQDTVSFLNKSFYKYKSIKNNTESDYSSHLEGLINWKQEIDNQAEDIQWTKEISFKTAINPDIILAIGNAIDNKKLDDFLHLSVCEFVEWFFDWAGSSEQNFAGIFSKPSILFQIKKAVGLQPDNNNVQELIAHLPNLTTIIKSYLKGNSYRVIMNKMIELSSTITEDMFLTPVRQLVLRLIPELSFVFGMLTQVIIEKARQNGISKKDIPWTVRALATCIREGMDDVDILFFKLNNNIRLRVDAHILYLLS